MEVELYSKAEIRQIFSTRDYEVDWRREEDEKLIFSVGAQTDGLFSIGIKPAGYGDLREIMSELDLNAPEWQSLENQVTEIIGEFGGDNFVVSPMVQLPHVVAHILDPLLISRLKQLEGVTSTWHR